MSSVGNLAVNTVLQLLTTTPGVNASVASISQSEGVALQPIPSTQILTGNVTYEIAEKSGIQRYTSVYVYCEKIANTLKEKFRTFSGTTQVTVEVRASQDRLEGIDQIADLYSEAVMQVLDQSRGDWGQGLFYSGGYEAVFGAVKHGGSNFIKAVKVTFDVQASIN